MFSKLTALLVVYFATTGSLATPVQTREVISPTKITRDLISGGHGGGILSGNTLGNAGGGILGNPGDTTGQVGQVASGVTDTVGSTAGGVVGGLGGSALGSVIGQQGGQTLGNTLGTAEAALSGVTGAGILHGL